MAHNYVSTYRRLLKTRTSDHKPLQLGINGSNGFIPASIEKTLPLFETGTNAEVI
jgi:hypothetical protein